ncbi:3-hydroxyisobutyrate mitochondrial [Lichtheimia corymbifera JMRC:FSU:9682]|uniref:3-hydroxyisobutyrate dehydrogenase n=1 Tax=Lichtheimia corymbifera JMRC:FSU:9682 TaxID=1263082 RepID=A0A068S629_9FUNG|nr:3-hydroxyisobutyrate mitochondrial [Lichtheimia corymbifera JMRC:FSU:9682]
MGTGMGKNLALKTKPGTLLVYDVNKAAVERFVDTFPQAKAVSDPGEMAEKAGTVVTMLPEATHVEQAHKALWDALDESSLLVDSSTIAAEEARRLATKVMDAKKGTAFDAPVSGGAVGADAGTLTFMVGGPSAEAVEKIKPTLSLMGRNVVYCGQNGTGQVAKLCNNMLLAISMAGVSEAMLLGARLGMDPLLLGSIINNSTGRCWSSDTNNPHPGVVPTAPASRDYQGGFSTHLMAKDLRLAMKSAEDSATNPVLGTMAAKMFNDLAKTDEYGKLDFSSVYKWMTKQHS